MLCAVTAGPATPHGDTRSDNHHKHGGDARRWLCRLLGIPVLSVPVRIWLEKVHLQPLRLRPRERHIHKALPAGCDLAHYPARRIASAAEIDGPRRLRVAERHVSWGNQASEAAAILGSAWLDRVHRPAGLCSACRGGRTKIQHAYGTFGTTEEIE